METKIILENDCHAGKHYLSHCDARNEHFYFSYQGKSYDMENRETVLELQKLLSKRSKPYFVDENRIEQQLIRILDLSSEGLKQRKLGEEILLAPLYERAQRHTNPARTMLDGINNGIPMINYIEQYAAI